MTEKRVCVKCEREGGAENKFCEHCGGKLKAPEAAPRPLEQAREKKVETRPASAATGAEAPTAKNRAWLIFVVVVWIAAVFLRFYDLGNKPLHHDESIHAMGTYDNVFHKLKYKYNPGYHGPVLYYLMGSSFYLFGDSDASTRFPAAVFGLMMIGLAFLFKRWLGTAGSVALVLFLVMSPTLLYMSRFARMDILITFFTLGMIYTGMRYGQTGKDKHLVYCTLCFVLCFATKEITYINAAVLGSFLLLKFLWDLGSSEKPSALFAAHWQPLLQGLKQWRGVVGLALGIAFLAFYSAFTPVGDNWGKASFIVIYFAFLLYLINSYWVPLVESEKGERLFNYSLLGAGLAAFVVSTIHQAWGDSELPRQHFYEWGGKDLGMALLFLLVAFLILALAMLSLGFYLKSVRKASLCLLIFIAVFTPLFTTFSTNLGGFTQGTLNSFAYWMGQHIVERGSQPTWYYLMLLPANELFPLLLSIAAAIYLAIFRRTALVYFAIWWSVLSLVIYSLAGERMPWLTIHMSLPIIFLCSLYIGEIWPRLLRSWVHLMIIALSFCLLPLYFRTSIGLSFHRPADPVEPMVYVQTGYAPIEVASIVREIAQRETGDHSMHMTIEANCSWPFAWYLRDYPHKAHPDWIGKAEKNPIVITGIDFKTKDGKSREDYNESILGDNYVSRKFRMRVWWAPGRDRHKHDLAGVANITENNFPRPGYWWRNRELLYDFLVYRKIWNVAMTLEKDENGNMVEKYDRWADAFNMRLWIRKDVYARLQEFPAVFERDKRYR